ncbi:hypothetical protein Syun_001970 [Stephania yunnanensis]|uniref:Annexin n=1 Tax=Stephania yunnanensis TaxID=152371 RepID=A0AAP0LHT9_9MAGN
MSTVRVPDAVPTPNQDSEALRKAFQGWGTDEKAIIRVLGQRNAFQRRKIREAYRQLYNELLVDRLFSELSGDFRTAVILWTLDPAERDAKLANEALTKKKRKIVDQLKPIIEIACATSPQHLMSVRKFYRILFNSSLEEAVSCTVSPPLRKLLMGLVSSYRYEGETVDGDVSKSDATLLHDAMKKKKLDDENLVWILTTRSFFQLRATFEFYKQNYGNPIDKDIKKCSSSDLSSILQMAVCCIDTPEKHFAEVVRASIVGLGTDEASLTRAIVSRAEIDMMKVRGEYFNANKCSLDNAVIGDTSGDYKDFLMTLLGAKI